MNTDLLTLHQEGQLAARYPQVAPLLADVSGTDLRQAGNLLARLDIEEVLDHHPDTPVVTIGITGHGTLSALVPALTSQLARHGLLLRPHLADFDGYVHDLSDPDRPLHSTGAAIVLCVLDPMMVLDKLATPWRVEDVKNALKDNVRMLDQLATKFAAMNDALLVYNTLPLPRIVPAQLVDHRSRAMLGAVWNEANAELLRLSATHSSLVVLDLNPLLAEGAPAMDIRLSTYTKSHLSAELLAGYAREVGHLARNLTGGTCKVLALDLDNTVWGGVLGEDGHDGIELAGTYRGEAFRGFQRVVKQLASQGVLLTAVSKNNPEPVHEVLAEHPDMILRAEDFVTVAANWQPKPDNIRQITHALNLTVDSVVFLDDSPYEYGLVRHELPQVKTVALDDEPALHVERLLRDGWFDVRELTPEDRARPQRYRDDQARGEFLQTFDSIEDYLRELNVEVELGPARERDLARVSQLTLRTNQFNLTTTRLQPAEVRALANEPTMDVLTVHSRDRFGDNGLVGAVFLRWDSGVVYIENFLLSCRVFARGIERACMSAILRRAVSAGATAVRGRYRPSQKNSGARVFLPSNGFEETSSDETEIVFQHDLRNIMPQPEYVHLTYREEISPQ